jgi:hypothetical protein
MPHLNASNVPSHHSFRAVGRSTATSVSCHIVTPQGLPDHQLQLHTSLSLTVMMLLYSS